MLLFESRAVTVNVKGSPAVAFDGADTANFVAAPGPVAFTTLKLPLTNSVPPSEETVIGFV